MRIDLFFRGGVRYAVSDANVAKTLELIHRSGCVPKDVRRGNGEVRFSLSAREARFFEGAEGKHGGTVRVFSFGMPDLLQKLCGRPGLIAGVCAAVFLLIFSSLFAWEVEVCGAETVKEEEILKELAFCGLSRGTFLPRLDADDVSASLRQGDGRIAYAAVNCKGTVVRVEIKEAAPTPPAPSAAPANLVARCDGVITLPLVYRGVCLSEVGDTVRAGQILVSGLLETQDSGCRAVRAEGEIYARTVHTYTVTVPFVYEETVPAGKGVKELSLLFFGSEKKIFKNCGKTEGRCDIINSIKWYRIGARTLPVGFRVRTVTPCESITLHRDAREALVLAEAELAALLTSGETAGTLLRRTVETRVDGDGVTLICTAVTEENIAVLSEFTVE